MTPSEARQPEGAERRRKRDFFGRSQLSQFMDQTNPLAELTHKRRFSALGPGGLNRDRAGFEVRDVHPSHYGRICPIETPEGPNIGLINSMSSFAQNQRVRFHRDALPRIMQAAVVTKKIEYLTADQEEELTIIAQANNEDRREGQLHREELITGAFSRRLPRGRPDGSVPTWMFLRNSSFRWRPALIPFLEHDDANRALMGSNMQRQGVPLLWKSEAPFVGTGMESKVARDSRSVIVCRGRQRRRRRRGRRGGLVVTPDGKLPISGREVPGQSRRSEEPRSKGITVYPLRKFMRSNAGTCINQKPIVANGPEGESRALTPRGRSLEHRQRRTRPRAAIFSSRSCLGTVTTSRTRSPSRSAFVKDDVYTSIHIDEFEIGARDTKLGPEEITRDIPNVGEEALMRPRALTGLFVSVPR